MPTLDSSARRALRARAHHLDPVVSIGQQGLTPSVVHEIDIALRAHELIKIRVFGDDRDARNALLETVCAAVDAAPVQHLGKLLVIWRPNPEAQRADERAAPKTRARAPDGKSAGKTAVESTGSSKGRTSGTTAGKARRPRDTRAHAAGSARGADPVASDARTSSRRRRGISTAARPAPPAGVPRAALPRRRRGRA